MVIFSPKSLKALKGGFGSYLGYFWLSWGAIAPRSGNMVVLLYRVLYFMIWLALGASGGVVGVYDQPAAAGIVPGPPKHPKPEICGAEKSPWSFSWSAS